MFKIILTVIFGVLIVVCMAKADDGNVQEENLEIGKLPHCVEEEDNGYILVSTLDGKLSALTANGEVAWEVGAENGPLLASSIQSVELTNNGEWVRIIPSLSGSLYKFNGKTIDAIPINADNLLKSSFLYSSDIVIAGGRDVRTYGVIAKTGELLYECSSDGCRNITQIDDDEFDDIIVIERSTTTVRAHEPRTGVERWNFSVGYHNVKVPPASCINLDSAISSLNITAILPQGILCAKLKHHTDLLWQYVFETPIVKIWKWDGRDLNAVDVFDHARPSEHAIASPGIYLGMHNKQLYIHESMKMLKALQRYSRNSNGELVETNSWTRFPWKPVPAGHLQDEVDDSTALSVLYSSNYVDGNGYYFYTELDVQQSSKVFCEGTNHTSKLYHAFDGFPFGKTMFMTIGFIVMTAFLSQFKNFYWWMKRPNDHMEMQRQVSDTPSFATAGTNASTSSIQSVYNDARPVQSHFLANFNIISQLGKGGYGIVFEVQQKIDKANYAVKIIPLPLREAAQERVLREVVALAKLDHPNIVRYSTSWHEDSLPDFSQLQHIKGAADASFFSSDIYEDEDDETDDEEGVSRPANGVAAIDITTSNDTTGLRRPETDLDDDSFIVFEDEKSKTRTRSNSTRISITPEDETTSGTTSSATKNSESSAARPLLNNSSTAITTQSRSRRRSKRYSIHDQNGDKDRRFLFIQMQLCDKMTLKHWMVQNQNRCPTIVYDIYNQILNAVAYIHHMELIHRDLKPSNIFFNQHSISPQIKVGDFGLVTPMQDSGDKGNLHGTPKNKHTCDAGTALYMSPEQKQGTNYNYKVDIFSLGVILFELLVFFGTETERIMKLQELRRGQFPDNFENTHPNEYSLLKLMLSKSPQDRPSVIDIMGKIKTSINVLQ